MISRLVQSAFQTGCLSVASEALIRQVLSTRSCQFTDFDALKQLEQAIGSGIIRRECQSQEGAFTLSELSAVSTDAEALSSME